MSVSIFILSVISTFICMCLFTSTYYLSKIYQKFYPPQTELPDFKFIPPTPMIWQDRYHKDIALLEKMYCEAKAENGKYKTEVKMLLNDIEILKNAKV